MNDKLLTMSLMLFMIMIGINSFLFMASTNIYDSSGNPLNIYYGLDDYSNQITSDANNIEIGTNLEASSDTPSTTQGISAVTRDNNPVGLSYTNDIAKIGGGVQLVMLRLGEMFPILSPIINAIVALAFAIQGFSIAYLGSIMIRGILGRIT